MALPPSLARLIAALKELPGVGTRTAERLAFHLLRAPDGQAQELAQARTGGVPLAAGDAHWLEVSGLFRAVSIGNAEWGVPAYNGGLFASDKAISAPGAALAELSLPDATFAPALEHLLLIDTPESPLGPVDFRALGVREFGTIYEGLLGSELSVADIDLMVDAKGSYVPHRGRQAIEVPKGTIYLHDRSGARKSSGSYFTKSFAVEHLLDRALEPLRRSRADALVDYVLSHAWTSRLSPLVLCLAQVGRVSVGS